MTLPAEVVPREDTLYLEIQQFYARQMRLLDEGDVAAWAQTFTGDGVFDANAQPQPVAGREAIRVAAEAVHTALEAKGIQRRHWLGMLEVHAEGDGEARAFSYALILSIPRGGTAAVHVHTTCDDRLVREDGEWRVRHRLVKRDDLADVPR